MGEVPRFARDMIARVPSFTFEVVFDVGANIGQSCIPLAKAFHDARIYSFEPVRETYETLRSHAAPYRNIEAFNLALGAEMGSGVVSATPNSPANRPFASLNLPANHDLTVAVTNWTNLDASVETLPFQ